MNSQIVKDFRKEYMNAVKALESKFGITISVGTITYTNTELRFKSTCKLKSSTTHVVNPSIRLKVGDIVRIDHKRFKSTDEFIVTKVNNKTVIVRPRGGNEFSMSYTVTKDLIIPTNANLLVNA